MATPDSSGGEDSARFPFTSWCLLCGHVVRSKRHAAKHFAYCPKPHQLRCGCCGNEFEWAALYTEMMSLVMDCLDVRESVITVRRQFEAANRQIQFLRHQLQQVMIVNVFV